VGTRLVSIDLFVHTLRDIYYAERQIVQALPDMIEKAHDALAAPSVHDSELFGAEDLPWRCAHKQPVVICPRGRRRMVTKEYRPLGPKASKAIKFTDWLVEVAYVCESCGTEIKRTIREK
jgi:hypothetical protein